MYLSHAGRRLLAWGPAKATFYCSLQNSAKTFDQSQGLGHRNCSQPGLFFLIRTNRVWGWPTGGCGFGNQSTWFDPGIALRCQLNPCVGRSDYPQCYLSLLGGRCPLDLFGFACGFLKRRLPVSIDFFSTQWTHFVDRRLRVGLWSTFPCGLSQISAYWGQYW